MLLSLGWLFLEFDVAVVFFCCGFISINCFQGYDLGFCDCRCGRIAVVGAILDVFGVSDLVGFGLVV